MSTFNSSLSDQELRSLLKSVIIDGGEDSLLTENLIEMERKFAFSAAPIVAIPLGMEQQLLSQLNHTAALTKVAGKIGMKWLFTGLGSVCVATAGIVTYNQLSQQPPAPQPQSAIVAPLIRTEDTTKTAEPPLAPLPPLTSIPVHTPSTFITPVTEQAFDLEPLSPTLPTPVSSSISYSFNGGGQETAVRGYYKLALLSPMQIVLPQLYIAVAPPTPPDFCNGILELYGAADPIDPAEEADYYDAVDDEEAETPITIDTVFSDVKRIELNIDLGDIEVHAATGKDVKLSGTSDVLEYEQEKGTLKIGSAGGKKRCNIIRLGKKDEEIRELHLEVPHGTELILNTANGNITVADIKGSRCEAVCSFGNISIMAQQGDVRAIASSGDVHLSDIKGNVDVNSSFGDLNISHVTGDVIAVASSGNFFGTDFGGKTDIHSDFGDILLNDIGGSLKADANSGNIVIDSANVSSCVITSNFGDVTLSEIHAPSMILSVNSGNLMAKTIVAPMVVDSNFGNAEVSDMTGDLVLRGNSGDITINKISGNIDIDNQFGDLSITDSKGTVKLDVNSGDIESKNMELTGPMTVSLGFGDGKIGLKNDIDDLSFDVEASFGKVKINKGNTKIERENGSIFREKGPIPIKGNASSGNITFN